MKPKFIVLSPSTLRVLGSCTHLDYLNLKNPLWNVLKQKILLHTKLNELVLFNVPKPLWLKLQEADFENQVYVLSEDYDKTFSMEVPKDYYKVKVEPKIKFKSFNTFKWYLYWLKKGVFQKSQESIFYKLWVTQ